MRTAEMTSIKKIAQDSGFAEGYAGVRLSDNPYDRTADLQAWIWWRDGWTRGTETRCN